MGCDEILSHLISFISPLCPHLCCVFFMCLSLRELGLIVTGTQHLAKTSKQTDWVWTPVGAAAQLECKHAQAVLLSGLALVRSLRGGFSLILVIPSAAAPHLKARSRLVKAGNMLQNCF